MTQTCPHNPNSSTQPGARSHQRGRSPHHYCRSNHWEANHKRSAGDTTTCGAESRAAGLGTPASAVGVPIPSGTASSRRQGYGAARPFAATPNRVGVDSWAAFLSVVWTVELPQRNLPIIIKLIVQKGGCSVFSLCGGLCFVYHYLKC